MAESPAPAALLFRLIFFSFEPPGVVGLFSPPLVDFRTGAGRSSVLIGGGCGVRALFPGVAAWEDSKLDFVVEVNDARAGLWAFASLKAPGSPTTGFSSMYSLPYRSKRS